MIDLAVFDSAIAQLDDAMAYARSDIALADARLGRHLRAASIQAFEFTYELSVKMLKRYLVDRGASPASIETMDFNALIRLGYAQGLLREDIVVWRDFRLNRSITSHTYDEQKAQLVFDGIPRFLTEARHLLDEMKSGQPGA